MAIPPDNEGPAPAPIALHLDLSRHCVETQIKRQYHRALSEYFRAGADKARLEQIITLTRQALERMDFDYLRSHFSPLAGYSDALVTISQKDGNLVLSINGLPITLVEKIPSQ